VPREQFVGAGPWRIKSFWHGSVLDHKGP
jgi:hypothetical protein